MYRVAGWEGGSVWNGGILFKAHKEVIIKTK